MLRVFCSWDYGRLSHVGQSLALVDADEHKHAGFTAYRLIGSSGAADFFRSCNTANSFGFVDHSLFTIVTDNGYCSFCCCEVVPQEGPDYDGCLTA